MLPTTPYKIETYLDIVNGRIEVREKLLGIVKSRETEETVFSHLVTQYGLEDKAEWRMIGAQGTDYFGKFNYDAYMFRGRFYHLEDWLTQSDTDPTTVILEARQLLNTKGDEGLLELLHSLMPDDPRYTPEPPTTSVMNMPLI